MSFKPYPFYVSVFFYSLCHLSTSLVFISVCIFIFIGTASRDTTQHDANSFPSMAFMVFVFLKGVLAAMSSRWATERCAAGDTSAIEWGRFGPMRITIWLGASCSLWQYSGGISFRQVLTLLSSMVVGRHKTFSHVEIDTEHSLLSTTLNTSVGAVIR